MIYDWALGVQGVPGPMVGSVFPKVFDTSQAGGFLELFDAFDSRGRFGLHHHTTTPTPHHRAGEGGRT